MWNERKRAAAETFHPLDNVSICLTTTAEVLGSGTEQRMVTGRGGADSADV